MAEPEAVQDGATVERSDVRQEFNERLQQMFQGFGFNDTQIKANMLRMEEMRAEAERRRPIDYTAEPPESRQFRLTVRLPRFTLVRRLTPTGPTTA